MAEIDLEGKIEYSIFNLLITTTVRQNMIKVLDVLRSSRPNGKISVYSNVVYKGVHLFNQALHQQFQNISLNMKREIQF